MKARLYALVITIVVGWLLWKRETVQDIARREAEADGVRIKTAYQWTTHTDDASIYSGAYPLRRERSELLADDFDGFLSALGDSDEDPLE